MIHEKFGGPGNLYSKMKERIYSKANGFIFVSQSTEKDFKNTTQIYLNPGLMKLSIMVVT